MATESRAVVKAAPTPWRMEHPREGMAAVLSANGVLIAVMREVDARFIIEAVNDRARVEQIVYETDIAALVRGAYYDDTL